jgi:hypothetical protein
VLIEEALRDHELHVDEAIKAASRYLSHLKAWKKSCRTGHIGNRNRSSDAALADLAGLDELTNAAFRSWTFDPRAYLDGDDWRQELQAAADAAGLRTVVEDETLVSPPVIIRAAPGQSRLLIGKIGWAALHPKLTVEYLKKLRERSTSESASQQFLNAIYDACRVKSEEPRHYTRFIDLYRLFSLAPGWAKENSKASFAQQIYALQRSEVRTTRDGRTFDIEYPSGKPRESDILSIVSDDGRLIRYYGIYFR